MSHKFPKFEHIEISGSETGSTAFSVSTPSDPYLFSIDASSSWDGASRVMLRNSNDTLQPFPWSGGDPNARGLLHLDLTYTSSQQNKARDFSIWTYPTPWHYVSPANWNRSRIQLLTVTNQYENASELEFITNNTYGGVSYRQQLGKLSFGGYANNGVYTGCEIKVRAEPIRHPDGNCATDPCSGWYYNDYNAARIEYNLVPPDAGSGPGAAWSTGLQERFRMNGWGQFIIWGSASSQGNTQFLEYNYLSASTAPSLQVYGGSKLGAMTSDTHQVTGSLFLSGNSGQNPLDSFFGVSSSAYLDLSGPDPWINATGPGPNSTNLWIACSNYMYLGPVSGSTVLIGKPWKEVWPGEAPITVQHKNSLGSRIQLSGGVSFNSYILLDTAGAHSIDEYTTIVGVDTSTPSAPITASLPSAQSVAKGHILMFKDEGGDASTYPFVVSASVGEQIEGESDINIDIDKASLSIYSNGSNWFIYTLKI
tara:strand:- start:68 stop:1507 length:1440 start_codon:yes stop_codon:yes gene_type:complete